MHYALNCHDVMRPPELPHSQLRSSQLNSIYALRRAKNAKALSFWDVIAMSAWHKCLLLIFVGFFVVDTGYHHDDVLQRAIWPAVQDRGVVFMDIGLESFHIISHSLSLFLSVFDIWIVRPNIRTEWCFVDWLRMLFLIDCIRWTIWNAIPSGEVSNRSNMIWRQSMDTQMPTNLGDCT